MNRDTGDIDRRTFLRRFALLSGMLAACPLPVLAELRERSGSAAQTDAQAMGEPWQTLDAVQRHLFPAGQAIPGAADIGALAYLRNAIDNPDADGEDRTFVVNGVGWLNELTQEQYQRSFVELDQAQHVGQLEHEVCACSHQEPERRRKLDRPGRRRESRTRQRDQLRSRLRHDVRCAHPAGLLPLPADL